MEPDRVPDRITDVTNLIDSALGDVETLDGLDSDHADHIDHADYIDQADRIDHADHIDQADHEACWRCGEPSAEDSPAGLCRGCRAFLLEDTEVDPAATSDKGAWPYDAEPRLEPADDEGRPGPIENSVEASFPGYRPATIRSGQWERRTAGWDPGPIRFTHGGSGRARIIGYWLETGGDRLSYTIFYEPEMIVAGGELVLSVTWPPFGSPPIADVVVRLCVKRGSR
jgi:hypothetical protein